MTVKSYKRKTGCTVKQAEIAMTYFNYLRNKLKKIAKCPDCGGTLYLECGSFEEEQDDYIGCLECDFGSAVEGEYKLMSPCHDFDVILFNPKSFTPKLRKELMRKQTKERLLEMKGMLIND